MKPRGKTAAGDRSADQNRQRHSQSMDRWAQACTELGVTDATAPMQSFPRLMVQGNVDGVTFRVKSNEDSWLLESPADLQDPWKVVSSENLVARGTHKDLDLATMVHLAVATLRGSQASDPAVGSKA